MYGDPENYELKAALAQRLGVKVSNIRTVKASLQRIASVCVANGLDPLPTATNFVTVDCLRDGLFAKRVLDELINRDVFVRMPGVAPLNRCIRVSAGTTQDLKWFEQLLPEALKAASV